MSGSRSLYSKTANFKQRATSSYHFYIGLYTLETGLKGTTFSRPFFLLEIDRDDYCKALFESFSG